MKAYSVITFVFLFILTACTTKEGEKYQLRPYEQVTLQNGLQVLLVKDKSLPYFSLQMLIKSGAVQDPVSKAGLSNMVASLLNKSTEKHNATQIADIIGQMGADYGDNVEDDYTFIAASSLSGQRNKLIEIFSEIITQANFNVGEIERTKKQIISGLKKIVDNPPTFASVVYSSFIYGPHPYGRNVLGTIRDVNSIKQKDLIEYYKTFYTPNNSVLAITGDFDDSIIQEITKAFSSWKSHSIETKSFPMFPAITGVNIKLIDKPDLAQTQIRIGHKAIKRTNPDFLKLRLASIVLGGGFSSRLMSHIRKDRGLTYSISSFFGAEKDFGTFTVSTFTRHDKVGETVSETLSVLNKFKKDGITQAELDSAKALAKGTFPQALETAESFSRNLLLLRFYGISDDYLSDYYKNINKITLDEVNKAIESYLSPENLKILVYAPKQKTIDQLRPIGLLEVEDYKQFIE
ncbi:MAG: insulinase family protein [Bdellovibrionaceae bacterium]|nr:insulinase family protein [Pseudobdellovibrionaceae bacterium]